jgi:hypothetical protein
MKQHKIRNQNRKGKFFKFHAEKMLKEEWTTADLDGFLWKINATFTVRDKIKTFSLFWLVSF